MKSKTHMKWAWIIIIGFFILGIMDFRFGILGFACMGAPIYHSLRGRGKVHCSKYCPRGSMLGKFLQKISLQKSMPKFMMTKTFKHGLLVAMLGVFSFSMYHAGWNFNRIAFSMFRFMTMSAIVGVVMGVFFKPRSWCTVCPMGTGTTLVQKKVGKRDVLGDLAKMFLPKKKSNVKSDVVQFVTIEKKTDRSA